MSAETVNDWKGDAFLLKAGTYFHWMAPGSFLSNNAKLSHGVIPSVSALAEMPGLENATTPYAVYNVNPQKEQVWEKVRLDKYSSRPPRLKAFFCFDSKALAIRAKQNWFPYEDRRLIEVRLTENVNLWRADTKLLDTSDQDVWPEYADRYWRGDMTEQPFPEILVHGYIYLPEWQSFKVSF